jgi:hypothetical protein
MEENDIDRLVKLCGMLGSRFMGERATAAEKVTELLEALGLTWAEVLGKSKPPREQQEQPRWHKYNGFISFAEPSQSCYDEARGYTLLLATKEERPMLIKIMQKDVPLRELSDEQHDLMSHLRDEARELRDIFIREQFQLKSGRWCRIVSSQP